MERRSIIISCLFILSTLTQAQTKVVLSYRYPSGVMPKEIDAAKSELVVAYDHDLIAISGLENLPQLRSVSFIGLDNFTDLSAVLRVPKLESIVLDAMTMIGISDIEGLLTIPSLKSLIIRGCPGLASKRPISIDLRYPRTIKYVQIADSDLSNPPTILSIPESLQYLNLSGNRFTSFAPFEGIPTRIRVYLFGNPIKGKSKTSNIVMDIKQFFSEVPSEYQATY